MVMRTLTTTFADPEEVGDDPQEVAGDPHAYLEEGSDCPFDPKGHLFLTSCGETVCVHCKKISWS